MLAEGFKVELVQLLSICTGVTFEELLCPARVCAFLGYPRFYVRWFSATQSLLNCGLLVESYSILFKGFLLIQPFRIVEMCYVMWSLFSH